MIRMEIIDIEELLIMESKAPKSPQRGLLAVYLFLELAE